MKTNSELRTLSEDELKVELISLRRQQFALRLKKANGELNKTHQFSIIRNAVARVKTIMTEKVGTKDDK